MSSNPLHVVRVCSATVRSFARLSMCPSRHQRRPAPPPPSPPPPATTTTPTFPAAGGRRHHGPPAEVFLLLRTCYIHRDDIASAKAKFRPKASTTAHKDDTFTHTKAAALARAINGGSGCLLGNSRMYHSHTLSSHQTHRHYQSAAAVTPIVVPLVYYM